MSTDYCAICVNQQQTTVLQPSANEIDQLLKAADSYYYILSAVSALSFLLTLLLLSLVAQAFLKRLWLLPSHPSRVLAFNAGTLALLGIVAKVPQPGNKIDPLSTQYDILSHNALICTMVGALMPSVATSTRVEDMRWTNVLAVEVVLVSAIFITFLQFFYVPPTPWPLDPLETYSYKPTINRLARANKVIVASLSLMSSVLGIHAMALQAMMSDTKILISERLEQLSMETNPGFVRASATKKVVGHCSWAVMERNTRAKLTMVFTSKPEHLIARSPSAAILGILALLCTIISNPGIDYAIYAMAPCCFICLWRWGWVALQEDRRLSALVFGAEPSYWRRKMNDVRHMLKSWGHKTQPNALEEGRYGFQEALCYATAILMLCLVVPIHWLLVTTIRFFHIFSALLMHKVICPPFKAARWGILVLHRKWLFPNSSRAVNETAQPSDSVDSLGVICLEGEDARIVGRAFAGAAARSIGRALKRANTKSDLRALISLLQTSSSYIDCVIARRSNGILEVLKQEGAPFVQNLQVKHGYQFGWGLTVISLLSLMTKVEVTALAKSMVSEAAMNACWQALEMMQLVDEQFASCLVCSYRTYARACAVAWSRLQTKKRRWGEHKAGGKANRLQLDDVNQILNATLATAKMHMDEFNKASSSGRDGIATSWSEQTVESYTMYTVCQNLSRRWMDMEAAMAANGRAGEGESNARRMAEDMVEHIKVMIGEFIACCISSLPIAVDRSTTQAVLRGKMRRIEQGIVLVAQGKRVWEELKWSTVQADTSLGKLGDWMQ